MDNHNVFLVSGPQGDFLGALRRLAANEFSGIKINTDDIFVFSSKTIPGNEKKVSKILNLLTELGASIITANDHKIHASGHSGQIDIKKMCDALNPTHYIPIHGESFLLKYHYEFIKREYPHIQTQLIFNHHKIIINKDHFLQISPQINNPPVLIHGNKLLIDRSEISERRKLASQGVVFVSLNALTKKFIISQSGLPLKSTTIQNDLELIVNNFIRNNLITETGQDEALRIIIRQKLGKKLDYKPIVFVHIHHH